MTAGGSPRRRRNSLLAALLILAFSVSAAEKVAWPLGQSAGEDSRSGVLKRYQSSLENGHLRRREGYYREAIELYGEACELARALEKPQSVVRCLILLGLMNWAAGFPEESQRLYSEALEYAQSLALEEGIAECRRALEIGKLYLEGKTNRLARRNKEAAVSFGRAAELAERSGSQEHRLKCLRQWALALAELGDRAASLATNEEGLRLARKIRDRREAVKCLINIGVSQLDSKDYSKALNSFSEGLDLSRAIGAAQDESNCLKNIGLIMTNLGFIEGALDHFLAAQEIDEQTGPTVFLPYRTANLGVTLRRKAHLLGTEEDLLRAYDFFSRSAELAAKSGDRVAMRVAFNALGNVCLDRGKKSAALHYFESSAGLSEGGPDPLSMIEILTNMGICHLELGNIQKAEDLFVQALALGDSSGRRQVLWEPLFHLGRCHEETGMNDKALQFYRSSIEAIEHVRGQLTMEEYRMGFARGKLRVYERLIVFLADLMAAGALPRGEAEVFSTVEKAKARAFLESRGDFGSKLRNGLPEPLKERERAISSRIAAIIGELSRKGMSTSERARLRESLRLQEDEYLRLVSRMREEIPASAEVAFPQPIQLDQARTLLADERAAILEYFLAEDRIYLFVITKEEAALLNLMDLEEINSSLRAYIRLLSQPPAGDWEGGWAAAGLARGLLFPALRMLPDSIEHLIIIPDGFLSYLPFETLPLPPGTPASNGGWLISRYSVSYAPSCSALLSLQRKSDPPEHSKDFLAFGDPDYHRIKAGLKPRQPHIAAMMKDLYAEAGFDLSPLGQSGKEIRRISKRFSEERRDVLLGKAAYEEALKEAPLEKYQIIHFACHAFLDDRVPFRSGLFLSPGGEGGEDGLFQAREIASLRMNAAMVVLSACQTSRGYLQKGEGIMGLTRAFFYSGARSVLSTLWEIEDRAAAVFIGHFYGFLYQGKTLSQALRSAKLETLKSGYDHPFYWAAFILNGEPFSRIGFR